MRGDPSEKSARAFAFEDKFRQQRRRTKRQDSKVRERYRMFRPMQHWLQELNRQIFPVPRQRFHQAPICTRIFAQFFRRNGDVFKQRRSGAVVERMRQWNFGFDPFKTEALQRERLKKRRACCKWMNCRTDVMQKARQSELGRTRAAADCCVSFVNKNGTSRARQCNRCRETIRSRADDNRIVFNRHIENS